MMDVLWRLASVAAVFCGGWFLFRLTKPFVQVRKHLWGLLLYLTFSGTSGMVIWIGDPNLLYTLPVFLALFFLCTQGDRAGRLAIAVIVFCLTMSVSALADTYVGALTEDQRWHDLIISITRLVLLGLVYLALLRKLPPEPVTLSPRLWKLVLGLAAMPMCSLTAVVLLSTPAYRSQMAYTMAMELGLAVLPVVLLTSVVLLTAVLVLARHEALEQAQRLASLREVYYQGVRQQEQQVRRLRHDLRNHLTALLGLLEREELPEAKTYLEQMEQLQGLQSARHYCENEVANIVLSAKAAELERDGVAADFSASLPSVLSLSDTDLCALLGNALDNAREGVQGSEQPWVRLRCRVDKGLLMLRVENPVSGPVAADLSTSKADKTAHGFGIPGMREIAERCGGTLDAGVTEGVFHLVVCLAAPVGNQ